MMETLAQLFPEGTAPVAISVLSQMDGVRSVATLQKYANEGRFYADCYRSRRGGEAIPVVGFLEPENLKTVFSDTESRDYARLRETMQEDERIREHTRVPWGVFDVASINRIIGLPGTSQEARKRLEDHKGEVYAVSNHRRSCRSTFYLLNMLTASCAVPINVEDREGKIEALRQHMMGNYERQEARVKGRLEETVEDAPADTRLEIPKASKGMLDTLAGMFPQGAVAISTAVLSQFETALPYYKIKGPIADGAFYGEVYRARKGGVEAPRVLLLEPSNIGDVFQEEESAERDLLMRELAVGKLTDVTRKGPWKLFDISEIYQVAGIATSDACVREALKDNEHVYAVPNHGKDVRAVYYLLTLENIEHILPPGTYNREERAKRLQDSILANYDRQKVWVNRKLEDIAAQEHLREDARIGIPDVDAEITGMLGNMFGEPVVPVATAVLGKFEGTREYNTILGRARAGVVYGEVMKAKGKAEPVARVVFLGESDLEQVFRDTTSDECDAVRAEMGSKRFVQHTSIPWKVYDMTELNSIIGFTPVDRRAKLHMDKHPDEVYIVPEFGKGGKSTYYLLNLGTACQAIPYGIEGRAEKVKALQQDILANASGAQKEWTDKRLEEIASQEAAAREEQLRQEAAASVPEVEADVTEMLGRMFPEPVVPVATAVLGKFDSTAEYNTILNRTRAGTFYGEVAKAKGKAEPVARVVFLGESDLEQVFRDTTSDECDAVRAEMGSERFVQHTQQPWKVYDMTELNKAIGFSSTERKAKLNLDAHPDDVYIVPEFGNGGRSNYYLLNLETAVYAVPEGTRDRDAKIEALRQDILDNAGHQKAWVERDLETVARQEAAAAQPISEPTAPPKPVVEAAPTILTPKDYSFIGDMFQDGAIAFCLHPLGSWDFTVKYKDMAKYARQGRYHTEVIRGKNQKPRVGVFEPRNIGVVFKPEGRDHCSTYRSLAEEGGNGLVEFVREGPWKMYDAEMISGVIGMDGEGHDGVLEEMRRNGEHLLQVFSPVNPESQIEAEEVFLVTMDTANLVVPQYLDQRDQKVELLRQDVLGNVERLRVWAER